MRIVNHFGNIYRIGCKAIFISKCTVYNANRAIAIASCPSACDVTRKQGSKQKQRRAAFATQIYTL